MAKKIKLTEEEKKLCVETVSNLLNGRLTNGKVEFTQIFATEDKKATIRFEPVAYIKMMGLVYEFSTEVAWHGVCTRSADVENEYIIHDIVVYPQRVNGSYVDMDPEEYGKWLFEHITDERFNHLSMQGHSHVNMDTGASGEDMKHQKDILDGLFDDGFYVFMIWNKSRKFTSWVYDLEKGIMFENKDITVIIDLGTETLDEFIADAKTRVKSFSYTQKKDSSPTPQIPQTATPVKTATTSTQTKTEPKSETVSTAKEEESSTKVPIKDRPITRIGAGWAGKAVYEDDEDDDYDYLEDVYGYYSGKIVR